MSYDQEDESTAFHEVSHAVAFREGGLKLGTLEVYKFWGGGVCPVKLEVFDDTDLRAYLVGLVAGCEGELRWGELRGVPVSEGPSSSDFSAFHTYAPEIGLSEAAARSEASSILLAHWDEIEAYAPTLAAAGRMSGSAIA